MSSCLRLHILRLSRRLWLLRQSLNSSASGGHLLPSQREPMSRYSVPVRRLPSSDGSHCSPGYFGVQPGSLLLCPAVQVSLLVSPCPFWTKPIARVGLRQLTTNVWVRIPIHAQLCSAESPVRLRDDRLSFPLRQLENQSHRRGMRFTSAPEGQELHLHRAQVLQDLPSPSFPCLGPPSRMQAPFRGNGPHVA